MTLMTEEEKRRMTVTLVNDEAPEPGTVEPGDLKRDLVEMVREESNYQINPAVAERWIRAELDKLGFYEDV